MKKLLLGLLLMNVFLWFTYASYKEPIAACLWVTEIPEIECHALVSLYNSTDWDNWTWMSETWDVDTWSNANWSDMSNICGTWWTSWWWIGITCYDNHVTSIDLRNKNLSWELPFQIWNLTNLWGLYLPNNHITNLWTWFTNLTWLSTLDLSWNYLTYLPTWFWNLTNLWYLDLQNNQLTVLSTWFGNLDGLRVLYLRHNLLTSLPSDFSNLCRIQNIYLDDNQLTSLPSDFGNMNSWCRPFQLVDLNLSNNQLTSLPASFTNLTGLEFFHINNNQLSSLPSDFWTKLQNIRHLSLGGNQFTWVPAQLFDLPKTQIWNGPILQRLDLSNNLITALPANFGDFYELRWLYLDGNQLATLPSSFSNLSKLESLYISWNLFTDIPQEIKPLIRLKILDTSFSQFMTDNLTWNIVVTWTVQFSWATSAGVSFTTDWILEIKSIANNDNTLQLNFSWLSITTSNSTWDKIILPPWNLGSWDIDSANFWETWIPVQTESWTTREILWTIIAGSESDSLIANGWYFRINFVVSWWNSWDVIKLYRSNDWDSWIPNVPDTECVLNSGLICTFDTNHLSYFSPIKETESIAPILSWYSSISNTTTQTPTYFFTSNEVGTITYSGSCSSATTNAISGTNTITFNSLSNGTYSTCKLRVTDSNSNTSDWLSIPSFTVNYTSPSGWWGGWGWWTVVDNSTGNLTTGNVVNKNISGGIINSPFSVEFNDAYLYAYRIGITTMPTIQQANIEWNLIRRDMAKMMVNYAIKVMSGIVDTWRQCEFDDIENQSNEMNAYIKLSCQLGIMWVDTTKFNPDWIVTRAQFWTVLSRILYGNKYNSWNPYYVNHLKTLKENWIIKIGDPSLQELRGYVMLMLMRAGE